MTTINILSFNDALNVNKQRNECVQSLNVYVFCLNINFVGDKVWEANGLHIFSINKDLKHKSKFFAKFQTNKLAINIRIKSYKHFIHFTMSPFLTLTVLIDHNSV